MTMMEASTERRTRPTSPRTEVAESVATRMSARTSCDRPTAGAIMSRSPVTVSRDATLWTAWGLLHGSDVDHLVVVDDYRRPVGVLDERLVALEWPAGPLAPHRQRVRSLLRGHIAPSVPSGADLASVARAMLTADVDALPVTDRTGRLIGLVTTAHVLEHVVGCH